jgi:hypothetical protein
MKVYKPGTDCEVEFTILANGKKCPEFIKPEDDQGDSVAKVCYIPIADGDTITIQGNFTGSALVGRVDVLADGVFVADRIIDEPGAKDPIVKYWTKRRVEVKTFLHVPDLNDKKNHLVRPKVVEGNLVATRLSAAETRSPLHGDDEARSLGVGSLAVVVSLAQQSDDKHGGEEKSPYYPHVTLGGWRERTHEVAESSIRPEHELAMEVFPDGNPIKDKKATQYWRDQRADRFGSTAWAYLVFYYRSKDAIDEAGAQPLTESKALPPGDGTFIRAGEQALIRKVRHGACHSCESARLTTHNRSPNHRYYACLQSLFHRPHPPKELKSPCALARLCRHLKDAPRDRPACAAQALPTTTTTATELPSSQKLRPRPRARAKRSKPIHPSHHRRCHLPRPRRAHPLHQLLK